MPRAALPVPESYVSITRPVVVEVVRNVRDITGIQDDRFRISYQGYPEQSHIFNTNTGSPNDPGDTAFFKELGKISVRVTENYQEDMLTTTPVHYANELAVFLDQALNVEIKPLRHFSEVVIEFQYRAEDLQSAKAWTDMIRYKISEDRIENVHELPYEYSLPIPFMLILGELHRLRERQGGYGEDFGTWFNNHVSKKLTVLTKLNGEGTLLVFNEEQKNVYGWFDFTTPPTPEKTENGSTFIATFSYTFRYEKPSAVAMYYPIVVHNQLLAKKFRGDQRDVQYAGMVGDMALQNQRFDYFRKEQNVWHEQWEGIRLPTFDDWLPKQLPFSLATLALLFCQVNTAAPTSLGNIANIPGYAIQDPWLSFMKEEHAFLALPTGSPFHVLVFENDDQLDSSLITIDDELNITIPTGLDIRKNYHVMLTVETDLSKLHERATRKLIHSPDVCIELMKALDPSLEEKGLLPRRVGNVKVKDVDYERAVREMITTSSRLMRTQPKAMVNVGIFCIVASHK